MVYGFGRLVSKTEKTAGLPPPSFNANGRRSTVYIGQTSPRAAASVRLQVVRNGTSGSAALCRTVAGRCGLYRTPEPPRTTVLPASSSVHAKPARGPKFRRSGSYGRRGSRIAPKFIRRKSVGGS